MKKQIDVGFPGVVYAYAFEGIKIDKDFVCEFSISVDYDVDKIDREVKCAIVTSPIKANRKIRELIEGIEGKQSSISSPEDVQRDIENVQTQYDRDKLPPIKFVGRVVKYAVGNKTKITIQVPHNVAIEIANSPNRIDNSAIVIEGV